MNRARRGFDPNPKCKDCGAPVKRMVFNGRQHRARVRCLECSHRRRMAQQRQNAEARKHRNELIIRQNGKCAICGWPLPTQERGIHVDHVVPFSRGGGNNIGNLRATCAGCNMIKGGDHD